MTEAINATKRKSSADTIGGWDMIWSLEETEPSAKKLADPSRMQSQLLDMMAVVSPVWPVRHDRNRISSGSLLLAYVFG